MARDLNNLASLLQDMNCPGEAEPLYRRALEIWEKNLGPDHPNDGDRAAGTGEGDVSGGDYRHGEERSDAQRRRPGPGDKQKLAACEVLFLLVSRHSLASI